MTMWTLIEGGNFTGRSSLLGETLLRATENCQPFFVGPYGETGLSGFTTTVIDEHNFYGHSTIPETPWANRLKQKEAQAVSTLSGGEQVMLALSCLSALRNSVLAAIDGALEQLDTPNRLIALRLLDEHPSDLSISIVDHRLRRSDIPRSQYSVGSNPQGDFRLQLSSAVIEIFIPCHAPIIEVRDLSFSYQKNISVLESCSLRLLPACIYRLSGKNGSGKTTLLKLLCGVLRPKRGDIALDGLAYAPWRNGNKLFAYAMQNPDEQWTAPTPADDLKNRLTMARRGSKELNTTAIGAFDRLQLLAASVGISLIDGKHFLDYPRALRKRFTWVWPLSGCLPWIALDEPSLGQDDDAVAQLATALQIISESGHGVILISHDERLLARLPHREIHIHDASLTYV